MNKELITHTADVLGFASLTSQEVTFVQCMLRGLPSAMAAKQSGVPLEQLASFSARPHVASVLAYMREQTMQVNVEVNRDMLNLMLFEAHAKAANATEEINAVKELAKLNGLNAPQKIEHTHSIEAKTQAQLRKMSSEELAKIAGDDSLVIDGECETVNEPDKNNGVSDEDTV